MKNSPGSFFIHIIHMNLKLSTIYKIHKNRYISAKNKKYKKIHEKSYPHQKMQKM